MSQKTKHIVVTFENVTAAMAFEKKAMGLQLNGRIIPLPGEIGAGCGLCYALKEGQENILEVLLNEVEYEALYKDVLLY